MQANSMAEARPAGRSAEGEVWIAAPPMRVWRALTEGAELQRWFPFQARVEPGAGGSIWTSWNGAYDATHNIETWDPPHHLRTTWPYNAMYTDYYLEAQSNGTRLHVITSGFGEGKEWDGWLEGTVQGWAFETLSLKHYIEQHDGEDREGFMVRRKFALSRDEAWKRLRAALSPKWLEGSTIVTSPPAQHALHPTSYPEAMLRCGVEPENNGEVEAVVFVAAWGDARGQLAAAQADLEQRIAAIPA